MRARTDKITCLKESEQRSIGRSIKIEAAIVTVPPSRTSSPSNAAISTSTTSNMIGMSIVDPGIGNISSTIPLDLTNVSPNIKSQLEYITGIDLRPE